jgi:hypothetical protein
LRPENRLKGVENQKLSECSGGFSISSQRVTNDTETWPNYEAYLICAEFNPYAEIRKGSPRFFLHLGWRPQAALANYGDPKSHPPNIE